MENPMSRPAAATLINDVIIRHNEEQHLDMLSDSFRCGWSLCMKIYDSLLRFGYIQEEIEEERTENAETEEIDAF